LGFLELVGEFLELLAQLALKLEASCDGFRIVLGAGRVQRAATAEHGLLDLLGDDGADFPEIFPDGLNLQRGAEEKFQVALKITRSLAGLGRIEAFADEMMHVDLCML